MRRIPKLQDKRKICIICEGNEEFDYIERLNNLKVWCDIYKITLINAEGNGNIVARYQDKYQNDSYEAVYVFCDTDKKPYEQYDDIKRKINDIHGNDKAADLVVIFGNPCTMQIIILHWIGRVLKSHKKNKNAEIIEQFTGIVGYKARADQRERLFEQINKSNYESMKERVMELSQNDKIIGSSNFGKLIEFFGDEDDSWIKEMNNNLDIL